MSAESTDQPENDLEARLSRLYQTPEVDPDFAARLGARLESQARQKRAPATHQPGRAHPAGWNLRGLWELAGLALVALVVILAVRLLPDRMGGAPLAGTTPPSSTHVVLNPYPSPVASVTAAPAPAASPVPSGGDLVYRVQPGDTCASVAYRFNLAVESLVALNDLAADCSNLTVDQDLRLPAGVLAPPVERPVYIYTTAEQVNLRSGPGTDFAVVFTLEPGEWMALVGNDQNGDWLELRNPFSPGESVWVYSELVKRLDLQGLAPAVGAVQLTAGNLRRDHRDLLLVDVCFELPDSQDWMLHFVYLEYGLPDSRQVAPASEMSLVSLQPYDPASGTAGRRCDVIGFDGTAEALLIGPALTVQSLQAYPREGELCAVYGEKVQPWLDASQTGIQVSCQEDPHTSAPTVTAWPAGMSQSQAEKWANNTFQAAINLPVGQRFDLSPQVEAGGMVPEVGERQPAITALLALLYRRAEEIYPRPGWLHVLGREYQPDYTGPIPVEHLVDEWFYFDEHGRIARSASRLLDLDGNLLRVIDSVDTSEAEAELLPGGQEEASPPALDYGFTDTAILAFKIGQSLSQNPLYFERNYVGEQFVLEQEEVRREALYDPQSGKFLGLITYRVQPEALELAHSVTIEVMAREEAPPAEVQELFPSLLDGLRRSTCERIAFAMFDFQVGAQPDLYTVCTDGSQIVQLTDDPAADLAPAWSLDGSSLAFASDRTGESQIYLLQRGSDDPAWLTRDLANDTPIWLPDGHRIAFRTTDGAGLWWWRAIDLANGEIDGEYLSEPSFDHFFPRLAWSPDGLRVAYMSLAEQARRNHGASQIHVRDLDGSNDEALTHDTWANILPLWSPDGSQIAFLSERHGEYNIYALYVVDAAGGEPRQLSEPVYTEAATFSWSPDGREIVIGDVNIGRLYVIDTQSGASRELFELPEGWAAFQPAWQP